MKKINKSKNNRVLLEIGFEEIPADYLRSAILKLKELTEKELQEKRIEFGNIKVFYTVRRFVLYIENISDKQKELVYEKKGPKYDIAFKDGKLTEIGINFLKSNQKTEKDLIIKEDKNEKYVFIKIYEKGEKTEKVLKDIFPEIIKRIPFPKSMRWEKTGFLFARPIRWILCLFNNRVIKFSLASLTSGNKSKAHKYLYNNKLILIKDPDDYFKKMKIFNVILDQEKRKDKIIKKVKERLTELGLKMIDDSELLEKIASSIEDVSVNIGRFDEKYLFLPEKVIITAMKEHQRYFAVKNKQGKLTNYFINIRDGGKLNNDFITQKHSEVLYARLNDAEFFYKEDLKKPLINNLSNLKDSIFILGLGNMYEKVERLISISEKIVSLIKYENAELLKKIATLCKCDLTTNMVEEKEFANLRGYIGGIYLEKQGESENIFKPIKEHYFPNFVGDELPETYEGAIISLIDKLDNLCGYFIAGYKPTGSKDPYAVRRQALNIIYLIINKNLNLNLIDLIEIILNEYKKQFNKDYNKTEIIDFLKQREMNYFKDENIDYDLVNAVLKVSELNILSDYKKVKILQEERKKENFNSIIFTVSRIINIIPVDFKEDKVNKELFEESAEENLFDKFNLKKQEILNSIAEMNFDLTFKLISDLKPDIDLYFEKVLVMTENENKKNNRLAMLNSMKNIFNKFIDFSEIVIDRK